MIFISRCLRTKDVKRPFDKRCKNSAANESVLCKECMEEAKSGPIDILMHNDVTKQFGIRFKNQLTVRIHLNGKKPSKPDSKTSEVMKVRDVKVKLRKQLAHFTDVRLRKMHDELKLGIWGKLHKSGKTAYAIRYQVIEEIINKFASLSAA